MAARRYGVTADGTRWLIQLDGSIVCVICEGGLDPDAPDQYMAMRVVEGGGSADYAIHRTSGGIIVGWECVFP